MGPGKLIVHAVNVHQGGGKSLLWSVIRAMAESNSVVYLLDSRLTLPEDVRESAAIKRVRPSVLQRIGAEGWLAKNAKPEDTVLCFGNLPPLFKLRARTLVFVQNRYLIDDVALDGFPIWVRLRLSVERQWMSATMAHADGFVVQTPTMRKLMEKKSAGRIPVRALPFMTEPEGYVRRVAQPLLHNDKEPDFVYVATGDPHKNHRRLLEAWCLLAKEGLFPSLYLTVEASRFGSLCDHIENMKLQNALRVRNVGELCHQDVLALYRKANAAIYPSTFESFGLPLMEARQAGLPVLASELDYVRDVLDPEQTFDPDSALSIARAVKRFMGKKEPALPLQDAKGFLERLWDQREWTA